MPDTYDLKRLAWHEVGHAIFVNIFKDFLKIEKITIEPSEYGAGANQVTCLKEKGDVVDSFHFVIANIAGLVLEFSYEKRNDMENMGKIVKYLGSRIKPGNAISDSFDGDFQNMLPSVDHISESLRVEKFKIIGSAAIYIHNCLTGMQDLWTVAETMVNELLKHKTLNSEQINKIFDESGFNKFVIANQANFRKEAERLLKDMQST